MRIHCYTSFTFSYLARARVLAATVKKHHPEWVLWAVITDRAPEGFVFDPSRENFDRVIWTDELLGGDAARWLFRYDVVEACTAVKGHALHFLLQQGAEKVFYLDPDIAVFAPLHPMVEWLDEASIVLTPHQVDPDDHRSAIFDNEVASLRYGAYNLGFLAVRNDAEGRRFANWWKARLSDYCCDEIESGLFVDQKWCDLVPAFFDRVKIVRDPGYNVASWNLSNRRVEITADGQILVNEQPLRFYHFTKLGPVGDVMTQRYARDNVEVYELWTWYRREVDRFVDPAIPDRWWYYDRFENGQKIPKDVRVLYRNRKDLQEAFPKPTSMSTPCFRDWLVREKMLGIAKKG